MQYGEAIALVEEIAVHDGSHLASELAGMLWPASNRDLYVQLHMQAYLNVHRNEEQHPEPFQFPWPFPAPASEHDIAPEERDRLRAVLQRRSAFADR